MSGSDWSKRSKIVEPLFCGLALIGAVILVYAIGQNLGVSAGRNEVTAREHYEHTKKNNLAACRGRDGVALVECITEATESAQNQSDSRQDLFAQRDMADFAFWLLVFTGLTLGVTALGVWFVKRTLDATLQAVKDTGEATEEMRRANDINELIALNLESPAVLVKLEGGVDVVPPAAAAQSVGKTIEENWENICGISFKASPRFINIGKRPCIIYEFSLAVSHDAVEYDWPQIDKQTCLWFLGEREDVPTGHTLIANDPYGFPFKGLATIDELVVSCSVLYRDLAGNRYRSDSDWAPQGDGFSLRDVRQTRLSIGSNTTNDDSHQHQGG